MKEGKGYEILTTLGSWVKALHCLRYRWKQEEATTKVVDIYVLFEGKRFCFRGDSTVVWTKCKQSQEPDSCPNDVRGGWEKKRARVWGQAVYEDGMIEWGWRGKKREKRVTHKKEKRIGYEDDVMLLLFFICCCRFFWSDSCISCLFMSIQSPCILVTSIPSWLLSEREGNRENQVGDEQEKNCSVKRGKGRGRRGENVIQWKRNEMKWIPFEGEGKRKGDRDLALSGKEEGNQFDRGLEKEDMM